jgi:hypothetical protein
MSTDFHFQIDAANGGDSIGAVDRSRRAFAIPIPIIRATEKISVSVLSRPQFFSRALNRSTRALSSRRFQERDSILSHKPAAEVVPVK